MAIKTYLSIITLNVNRLNTLIKRHRVAEWMEKQNLYICWLQEIHFTSKDTQRLKVREWKKIFHTNVKEKKVGVAILIWDKTDFKDCNKRQIRTLHQDKGSNLRRRNDNCKGVHLAKEDLNTHVGIRSLCIRSLKVKVTQPCPTLWPRGLYTPWDSPGQKTRVGSLSLLQGIFPTPGSNPGLRHCRQILYQLSHIRSLCI